MWGVRPRAAGVQHIQGGVEGFAPPFGRAEPPATGMAGEDEPGDARPGGVGQIASIPAPAQRIGITGPPRVGARAKTSLDVGVLSVGAGMLTAEMSRHTTFRFCLDPTVEQHEVLARHAGAARFAFNQCLRMVKTALIQRKTDAGVDVPWSGFDLINRFNAWKKAQDAGRVLAVDTDGVAEVVVTGLPWTAGAR